MIDLPVRQIRLYQSGTALLIPKAPFARVCNEILHDVETIDVDVTRMGSNALLTLQEAAEAYLVSEFMRKINPR